MNVSTPDAPVAVKPGRRAVSEWALIQLQELILSGQLGAGDSLGEVELTQMLGVSRSPTSAALRQLEDAGLVDVSPTNGRRTVKRFGRQDADELYTIRLALEPLGARMAAERISPAGVRDLEALLHAEVDDEEGSVHPARLAAHFRFHAAICEASGITRLAQLLEDPWLQTRALLAQVEAAGTSTASTLDPDGAASHEAVLGHIRDGEAQAAEDALAEHLRTIREALLTAID